MGPESEGNDGNAGEKPKKRPFGAKLHMIERANRDDSCGAPALALGSRRRFIKME
jgi:hypothetical protein